MKKNKIEEEVMITLPACLMMRSWNKDSVQRGGTCTCVCSGDAALDTEKERSESTKKPTAGSA